MKTQLWVQSPTATTALHVSRRRACLGIAAIALITFALVFYANRFGADVQPDSAVYITSGVRFAHGEGISTANRTGKPIPQTWFPPLLSVVIAGFEKMHLPIYRAAGVFNAGCYALLVWLTGMLAYRSTGSWKLAVAGAAAVATNQAIYHVHSIILSEPLFLLWMIGFLWCLTRWKRSGGGLGWAVCVGAVVTVAILTRYAAVSLLLVAGVVILCSSGVNWLKRIAAGVLIALIGVAPITIWSSQHKLPGSSSTGRHIDWHPISMSTVRDGVRTLADFVVPWRLQPHVNPLGVLLSIIGVGALGWLLHRRSTRRIPSQPPDSQSAEARSLVSVSAVFVAVYVAFLIVSISFLDKDTPLDERILSPVVVPLVLIACWCLSEFIRVERGWRTVIGVVGTLLIVLHALHFRRELRQRRTSADLSWYPTLHSQTLDQLRNIPGDKEVYSDKPPAIFMASRIKTDLLPDRPVHPESDLHDAEQLKVAIQMFRSQLTDSSGGWVVFWHQLKVFGHRVLTEQDVSDNFVIADEVRCDDGILLRIDSPGKPPATAASITLPLGR